MIPNYLAHVTAARDRWPVAWHAAHRGGPDTEDFIRLLASYLHHEVDRAVGLNGKRGNPDDLSDDALCYRAPGQSIDVRTGERVSVIDVIASAPSGPSGPDGTPAWGEVWDPANVPTRATWVPPARIHDTAPAPPPMPPPVPAPPPDLAEVLRLLRQVSEQQDRDGLRLVTLLAAVEAQTAALEIHAERITALHEDVQAHRRNFLNYQHRLIQHGLSGRVLYSAVALKLPPYDGYQELP